MSLDMHASKSKCVAQFRNQEVFAVKSSLWYSHFRYLEQYKEPLREELENNPSSRNQKLPQKFQEMLNTMEYMGDQYSNGGSSTASIYGHRIYRGRPREDRV